MSQRSSIQLVLEGHIIDSMMLPQIMDLIMDLGGNFTVQELRVGQHTTDPSVCRLEVTAPDPDRLDEIVRRARELGALVATEKPATTAIASQEGVYP
ncbi:MAG: TIGR00300 family protein, partial [Candidatus Dormibacteraceae bacterium]